MDRQVRIYLEDTGCQHLIIKTIGKYVDSYTLVPAIGVYRGVQEKTLIIEILTDRRNSGLLESLCVELRDLCQQDCVLMAVTKCNAKLI